MSRRRLDMTGRFDIRSTIKIAGKKYFRQFNGCPEIKYVFMLWPT